MDSEPDHNYRVRSTGGIILTGQSKYLERNLHQSHFVKAHNLCNSYITSYLSVNAARVGHEGVCILAPPHLRAQNDGFCFLATLLASFSTAVGVRQISGAVHLQK